MLELEYKKPRWVSDKVQIAWQSVQASLCGLVCGLRLAGLAESMCALLLAEPYSLLAARLTYWSAKPAHRASPGQFA